jgi:hypothetical protein
MDEDDADYMQGSEDEVCPIQPSDVRLTNTREYRTMDLTTRTTTRRMSPEAPMSKTCITPQNVRILRSQRCALILGSLTRPFVNAAKKEDNPEEALKAFRAIVDQETEKGDWWVSWTLLLQHAP